ncbi:hypothetical protein KFZ56_15845 [Virgibacillus sp. NKC19-3]|uniref:hypothetical protein n=1 Tax=Virgibacillus saliphilus TaxID=2831674 RepID=UPI001C9B7F46|nr:hypothetical protein [Virgibacillus sp. NKC19-3]MBY7144496.1 hypothetical protein [Virgibacillus sp. NKC19-3]
MGKRNPIFILLVGMTIMILAACSDSETATDQDDQQSEEQSEQEQEEESGDKDSNDQESEQEKQVNQKPFQPIEPSKDAKSLEDHYEEDEKENLPNEEAHDESIERSVPVGEVLSDGKEDLSDGPLNDHRLVAFYGTPRSEDMGILGEYEPEEMMEKLKEQTAAYSDVDPDRPAVPTIELIATVAQRTPGPDGTYVAEPSTDTIDEYVELAEENDALLMLDIQLGQSTVMDELKQVESYLKLPHVHLAIDTEYSVAEGEIPGEDLGEVDGEDIQEAVEYVDAMVEENNLPDKMVLVHQFGDGIVTNKDKIKPTENVQVPLNYDGFGDPAIKMDAYRELVRNQPIQYGGFKLFYQNDDPLLEPEEVLQLDPAPAIVNYQ